MKVDSYKFGHYRQYKPGMRFINSYVESRGVEKGHDWKEMVVAGGPIVQEFIDQPLITARQFERLKERVPNHGPSFNEEGFKRLLEKHHGYAPVHVQMLPEGLVVPLGTPILQVCNYDPEFAWVTSFLETHLLRSVWYPSTVATQSFHIKRIIKRYMLETAGHIEGLDFKLHDFGARGVSSSESAQIGGMAHLYVFQGSDTFEAVEFMNDVFYDAPMAGFSVDAAEHSTVTSFGGRDSEYDSYEHLIKEFGQPGKLFSIVSDSYDLWAAIDNGFGGRLKEQVEALGPINSKLVIRPDSGDPTQVPVDVILRLMDKFGHTVNDKGYAVLPPYLGVLQGDGINEHSIEAILSNMKKHGLSAENIVFGMGGALLQQVNRDTLKFAMKASAAKNDNVNDGEWYDVYKDPVTDSGKRSKRGLLAVKIAADGSYVTLPDREVKPDENELRFIGEQEFSLVDIRERINYAL